MKIQMSILRDLIYGASAMGIKFNLLCEKVGIAPERLNDAEEMIDWGTAPYLWDHIVELSGDDFIGLHMGQHVRPSIFGIMGHLLQTCKTLHDVLAAISKYADTWSSAFNFSMKENRPVVNFYFDPVILYASKYPTSARQGTEMTASGTVSLLRMLSGKNIQPRQLSLAFPKKDVTEYRKACNCDVTFSADRSYLAFSSDDLSTQVLSHDRSLFFLFNDLLRQKKEQLMSRDTFTENVQRVLLMDFKGQVPPIDVIAASMFLNRRTFQRKLSAEKTTYRKVCQRLQKQLAMAVMKNKGTNMEEVASLMGYADRTSFRRAFNGWIKSEE